MSKAIETLYIFILRIFKVQVETSPNALRIASNAGWLFLDSLIRSGVGFFVGAAVARYLGPEQFGMLSYAMAIVSLFMFVGSLGLNEVVICRIIHGQFQREETLGTAFLLRIFGGSAAFAGAVLAAYFLGPLDHVSQWMVGIIAAGMLFQALDVIDFYFQSQVQSKYTVLARVTAFVLLAAVKIFLILFKAPLIFFAWAAFVEVVLAGFGLLVIYKGKGMVLGVWKSSCRMAQHLIRDSWPVFFSGICVMIYMKFDQIMLLRVAGPEEAGIYAAAVKVSEAWYVIGSIIISSVFPVIIRSKIDGEELYRGKLKRIYRTLILIGAAVSGITVLLARPAVSLLYGSSYDRSVGVLMIHVLGVVFVYLGGASTYALVAEGLQKYHGYRTVLGCLTNILLNLVLIPRFGAMGAAMAMFVSYGVAVFSIIFFKKTRPVFSGCL